MTRGVQTQLTEERRRSSELMRNAREAVTELVNRLDEIEAEHAALADAYLAREKTTQRLLFIAEHLFQMVPREVWRDSGGDDGQGYYEGDYRAEGLREELSTLRAAVSVGSPETRKTEE